MGFGIAVKENLEHRNLIPVDADQKWIEESIMVGKEQTSHAGAIDLLGKTHIYEGGNIRGFATRWDMPKYK